MRRELQLPIYSLHQAESDRTSTNPKYRLLTMLNRLRSRFQRLDSLEMREHSALISGSAYAGFVSHQRVGRAR